MSLWDVARLSAVNLIPLAITGLVIAAEECLGCRCGKKEDSSFALVTKEYSVKWKKMKDHEVTIKAADSGKLTTLIEVIGRITTVDQRQQLTKLSVTLHKADKQQASEHVTKLFALFPDSQSIEAFLSVSADQRWVTQYTFNRTSSLKG